MPNVIISDIEFNLPLNKVYVSTFGRGIWETSYNVITNMNNLEKTVLNFELYPSVNDGKFRVDFTETSDEKTIDIFDTFKCYFEC